MKKGFLLLSILSLVFMSFSISDKTTIDLSESSIEWTGKKITSSHEGTIRFNKGNLLFDNNQLVGGDFIVDMSSISVTDISGEKAEKLRSHLMNEDFFDVAKHPTAEMKFTEVVKADKGSYTIVADLTIKGISHPVTFDMEVDKTEAEALVIIDRTIYDIKYGSGSFVEGLGDKAILDDFELLVKLQF